MKKEKSMTRYVRERGFSLIEVLVTMALVAISMLGMMSVQFRSMSLQTDSLNRKAAVEMVAQLSERISANQTGYSMRIDPGAGWDGVNSGNLPGLCTANCTPDFLLDNDIVNVFNEMERRLPEPVLRVEPTLAGSVMAMTITVGWREPNPINVAGCNGLPAGLIAAGNYRCVTANIYP